ncbi:MAG: hypothetical protein Q4A86_05405 [Clostridia bacterium]|nr:hypothetical protein [Clostridia bacterium]
MKALKKTIFMEESMERNIIEKVELAVKDLEFVEQLAAAETAEAAQALFASKGIEFTLDEVRQIGAGLRATLNGEELDIEDLEAVAGGSALGTVASVVSIVSGVVSVVDFIGKRFGWWK